MIASMYDTSVRLNPCGGEFFGTGPLGLEGKVKVQKKWLGLILTLLLSFHAALPAIAVGAEGTGDASAQADAQSETGETQEEYAEGRAIIKVSGEFFQKRAKRTASSSEWPAMTAAIRHDAYRSPVPCSR